MKNSEDHFKVLRTIKNKPETSQREMAKNLGFSLGKLNYCLKALQKKGFIKINNFKKNPNKVNYIYRNSFHKVPNKLVYFAPLH